MLSDIELKFTKSNLILNRVRTRNLHLKLGEKGKKQDRYWLNSGINVSSQSSSYQVASFLSQETSLSRERDWLVFNFLELAKLLISGFWV